MIALVVSLLGITLGQPAAPLRQRLGDPIIVRPYAGTNVASYLRSDDVSAVLDIAEEDGTVRSIEIERERATDRPGARDAYGIALGMTREAVLAKRGKPAIEATASLYYPEDADQHVTTIYRFDGDLLESIKLIGADPGATPAPAGLAHLVEAPADGYATALLDLSPTVPFSQHFRDRYLALRDCEKTNRTTTIDRRAGRTFAIVTATCNDRRRRFYFDFTAAKPT